MSEVAPPKRWHTREDSGIVLDRRMRWLHDGVLVEHPKIIEVFNQGLVPTEDGRFQLRVGADFCEVMVEDAAYRVLGVDAAADRLYLRLSDRTGEALDASTLAIDAEGVFTARVKGGRAKARFSREAQVALGTMIEEREGVGLVIPLASETLRLPIPPDALR